MNKGKKGENGCPFAAGNWGLWMKLGTETLCAEEEEVGTDSEFFKLSLTRTVKRGTFDTLRGDGQLAENAN